MRILLWHGYLLGGTGSNVYTRMLAREWSRAGHDVTVLSQEPHPERYDLGSATAVRPDVGGLLPVFVLDRYEGYDVRRVQDCTRAELDAWVEANAAALRDAPAGRRRLHESRPPRRPGRRRDGRALRRQGARLRARVLDARERRALGLGRRGPRRGAGDVRRLRAHPHRPRARSAATPTTCIEVPPGVDIDEWVPEPREVALAALLEEARGDGPNPGNAEERLPDEGNAARLERFLATDSPSSSTSAS